LLSVLIADDHLPVRFGIKMLTEDVLGKCNISFATNGIDLFEKLKQETYHMMITDLNMPGVNIMQLIPQALSLQPKLRILVISVNPEAVFARRLLASGVYGYLQKDASDDDMVKAIRNISLGKKYISSTQLQDISLLVGSDSQINNPFEKLSTREMEVLLFLLKGNGPLEIANELNISASTASSLKARIFEKLEVSNLIEVSRMAQLYGLAENNGGAVS